MFRMTLIYIMNLFFPEILSAFLASKEYLNGQVRTIDVENVLAQAARFFEFYYWKCPRKLQLISH